MSRWLSIVLCLVLFTAVMLVLRWVLHATVPGAVAALDGFLGETGSAILIFTVPALAGLWAYREHRRQGSARRR